MRLYCYSHFRTEKIETQGHIGSRDSDEVWIQTPLNQQHAEHMKAEISGHEADQQAVGSPTSEGSVF